MATGNFLYDNRCIVVTDEDYEMGNIPPLGERLDGGFSSYSSRYLAVSDDFDFWDIMITSGYYESACIDYVESDRDVEYWLGSPYNYETKSDFFYECKKEFHLTEYRLRKVCGNIGNMNIEDYLEQAYERLTEYLRRKEESKVNAYLDGVKKNYGYEEYKIYARFSNGETMYQKIN